MKRIYLLLLAAIAVLAIPMAPAWGAMSAYQYAVSTGTATDMTGASTALGTNQDDVGAGGLSIGFTFNLDGTNYTTFSVGSNGQMGLGSTNIQTSLSNTLTPASTYPIITAFYDDLHTGSDGGVTYKTTGSSPNRVLTVEWKVRRYPGSGQLTTWTHQVRLYEGSNRIEFWYSANSNTSTLTASVGIGVSSSNYASVTTTGGANTVSYTTVNNSNSSLPAANTLISFTPCGNNITIAGDPSQGGTAMMANGSTIFSGTQTQRGNSAVFQPFTITNPTNACATRTFTYTLGGTNFSDYQISPTSGTLTAGQTNTPSITFTPSGTGVRSATLTITDNNGFTNTYTLAAQGSTRIQFTGNIAQGGTATVANGDTLMTNISVQRLSTQTFTPVTLTNVNSNGAAPPALITASISDPSGQFTLGGPASASLAAGQSFSPTVRFTPTGVGFQNGTLTITADGETRVYPLKAFATAPGGEFFANNVRLAPTVPLYSNFFGCVGEVANTQPLVVSNVGSGDFVINSIDFFQTDTNYAQGSPRYPLLRDRSGNPIRLDDYFVSTSPGVAPATSGQMAQFPIVIPQGGSRTLYLTFVGQEPGKRFARAIFNTNGQNFTGTDIDGVTQSGLLVVDLFANGIGGRLSDNNVGGAPKTMIFPDTRVGDSVDLSYTVFNTGDCDLRIAFDRLMVSSGDVQDFRLLSAFGRTFVEGVPMTGEAVLAPDASGSFTVRFKPQRGGSRRATLWMQTNDSATVVDGVSERGAYYIDLYGFGKAGLDFSNLKLSPAVIGGTASNGVVRIVNSSTVSVGIQSFTLTGGDSADFSQDAAGGVWPTNLPYSILPGAELMLGVQFLPTGTPGGRATTLRLVTTTGEVIDIAITGDAGSQSLAVSPGRLFVGNVTSTGNESRAMVMISNTGTLPIRLNTPTITGPGASEYRLGTLPRLVIEPGAVEYLEVTYAPINSGAAVATLTISSDAGTQTVSLEGTSPRTRPTDPTSIVTGGGIDDQPEITLDAGSTSSVRDAAAAAAGVSFAAVRPNPARERAELVYTLASGSDVRLELYDGAGRLVRGLASGMQSAGEHRVTLDVSELAAGVYHCRLITSGVEITRNVVVIK